MLLQAGSRDLMIGVRQWFAEGQQIFHFFDVGLPVVNRDMILRFTQQIVKFG